MPKYRVELQDGRVFEVEADSQPSEADVLAQIGGASSPSQAASEPNDSGIVDTLVNALPTIGGAAGGALGGVGGTAFGVGFGGIPGAAGGAMLGGMAGESAKQLINRVRGAGAPATAPAAMEQLGGAGLVQGGVESFGRGLVDPAAKVLYGAGMIPLKALRDKYGLQKLVNTGYEHNIMPTAGGAVKAGRLVEQSKNAQTGMAQAYDAAGGTPLRMRDAAERGMKPLFDEAAAAKQAGGVGNPDAIRQNIQEVRGANPIRVPAAQMHQMQRTMDAVAEPAFAAARRPGGQPVLPGSDASLAKGWSTGYRGTVQDAVGPEFAKQGQKTKTLYGVKQMANYRAEAPNALAHQIGGAVALGGVGAATGEGDNWDRAMRGAGFAAFASPSVRAGTALAARPAALYGTRAVDAVAGSPIEQLLREALIKQLNQP